MPDRMSLQDLDRDGALREGASAAAEAIKEREARGVTRGGFLVRGGLLAGAGLAFSGVSASTAFAQGLPKSDVEILNYALTLEYLEAAFYADALDKGELSGESLNFAQVTGAHEQAHVDALKAVLGSQAVGEPTFDFGDATSKAAFLETAQTLEDTGVAAYQGQGPRIKTPDVLASAGAILAVEARHAGWVRDIRGGGEGVNPAPNAFSEAMDMQAVLDIVESTGFIKS